MIFDRLRVDAVLAGPIICRSRRSALVFFADRCTSPLRSFSLLRLWLAVSTTPSSAALNRSQRILFWRFKLPFGTLSPWRGKPPLPGNLTTARGRGYRCLSGSARNCACRGTFPVILESLSSGRS